MSSSTGSPLPRAIAAAACLALGLSMVLASATPGRAEQRPKWELGAGGVFFVQPDYIGSDEYRFHPIGFPWFIYRGSRIKLDRESMQAKIFRTDIVRLDLSVSGQVGVDSDDNDRRHGMPDLDWVAQIGPTLRFPVSRSENGRHSFDVDVPVRAAIPLDWHHVGYAGLVASPKLLYRYEPDHWRFEANAGLEFGNNDYNEYYYAVDRSFATKTRPEYGADGGYAGMRFSAGIGRYFEPFSSGLGQRFGTFYAGVFARYFNLEGVTFQDSPLVASRHTFIAGVAVGWVWFKSKEMVPVGAEANLAQRAEESSAAGPADDEPTAGAPAAKVPGSEAAGVLPARAGEAAAGSR